LAGCEAGQSADGALQSELGRGSGFCNRSAGVSTPGEPLSFADFASSHPHVDGYQTLDHVGTARTQQVRSVFIAFAKIASHFMTPIRKAGHSPELAAFCIGESRTRMDIPDGCAKTVDDMQKESASRFQFSNCNVKIKAAYK
jgi:hypothetical protein